MKIRKQLYGYYKWQIGEVAHKMIWTELRKENWISFNSSTKQRHKDIQAKIDNN